MTITDWELAIEDELEQLVSAGRFHKFSSAWYQMGSALTINRHVWEVTVHQGCLHGPPGCPGRVRILLITPLTPQEEERLIYWLRQNEMMEMPFEFAIGVNGPWLSPIGPTSGSSPQ